MYIGQTVIYMKVLDKESFCREDTNMKYLYICRDVCERKSNIFIFICYNLVCSIFKISKYLKDDCEISTISPYIIWGQKGINSV